MSSTRSTNRSNSSSGSRRMFNRGAELPPPTPTRGLSYSSSAPMLTAEPKPKSHTRAPKGDVDRLLWSDSMGHLTDEVWPLHAVPLLVFSGRDRPQCGFREQVRFTLQDEKYIQLALRLRCGAGDRSGGGSVGLVHSPDCGEAYPGMKGQLAMVTQLIVQPDNSILLHAVGDLPFEVQNCWTPRGFKGLQIAMVQMASVAPRLDCVPATCAMDPVLGLFGRMLDSVPELRQALSAKGPFTVFVPTDEAFASAGLTEEDLLARPELAEAIVLCHSCKGKVALESMYNDRTMQALDGSILRLNFAKWPRAEPTVNDIPIQHTDILCLNGVVHPISGVMRPEPISRRRRN